MGAEPGALVGRVLKGKWRLVRLIGVGGTSAVYEGVHRNGKRAAVKVLRSELSRSEKQLRRFIREGLAANSIAHPAVVKVDDEDVDRDGSVFLVMELLDGESVAERARAAGGSLQIDEVLDIADELLDVLEAAHSKAIVHRDIKPANLFLTSGGSLKVLDFGLARLGEAASPEASAITAVGTLIGTPAYMAPEHARGRWDLVDGRSDLWSVGATMFSMLTGKYVHDAKTANEQLGLTMTMAARSVGSVASELPASLVALVDRALLYERDRRWASAGEMRAALHDVKRELGIPIAAAPAADHSRRGRAPAAAKPSSPQACSSFSTLPSYVPTEQSVGRTSSRLQASRWLAFATAVLGGAALLTWSSLRGPTPRVVSLEAGAFSAPVLAKGAASTSIVTETMNQPGSTTTATPSSTANDVDDRTRRAIVVRKPRARLDSASAAAPSSATAAPPPQRAVDLLDRRR
jgi:eukaryotic-like serine/threonine-protein kinase